MEFELIQPGVIFGLVQAPTDTTSTSMGTGGVLVGWTSCQVNALARIRFIHFQPVVNHVFQVKRRYPPSSPTGELRPSSGAIVPFSPRCASPVVATCSTGTAIPTCPVHRSSSASKRKPGPESNSCSTSAGRIPTSSGFGASGDRAASRRRIRPHLRVRATSVSDNVRRDPERTGDEQCRQQRVPRHAEDVIHRCRAGAERKSPPRPSPPSENR